MYYVTNLLLTLFAVAVAFGTVVVPLAMNRTVGPRTYNAIAQPLGVVMLALIAVCPLLAWRKTDGVGAAAAAHPAGGLRRRVGAAVAGARLRLQPRAA